MCTLFVFWLHIWLKHTAICLLHHPFYTVQHHSREYWNILKHKQLIFTLFLTVVLFVHNILIHFLFVDSSSSVAIFAQHLFSFCWHKGICYDFEYRNFSFNNGNHSCLNILQNKTKNQNNFWLSSVFIFLKVNPYFLFPCLRRKGQLIWHKLTCLSISGWHAVKRY